MTPRPNKYGAVRVDCTQGGTPHKHDSRAERARCLILHQRQAAGELADLQRQVRFTLLTPPQGRPVVYVADFTYCERGADGRWLPVVEDVKGGPATRTPVYRLKRLLLQERYGLVIREVG